MRALQKTSGRAGSASVPSGSAAFARFRPNSTTRISSPPRHCQTNWPGAEEAVIRVISGSKLLPLDEGSGSSLFENVSSVEMALVVEVVVD